MQTQFNPVGSLSKLRETLNDKSMQIKEMLITPEIAEQMLANNTKNRKLRPEKISVMANDMINGKWKSGTGETIKITKSGWMADGQHRLHAIIKSGRSFYFHVATNVSDDAFDVIDTQSKRSASDVLFINGCEKSAIVAGCITTYLSLKNGYNNVRSVNKVTTNQMILEYYNSNRDFWNNVAIYANDWHKQMKHLLTAKWIGGIYAHLFELNESKSFTFFEQLSNELKTESEIIRMLRHRLQLSQNDNQYKLQESIKMALIIKAWNYYVTDKKISLLRVSPKEEYPVALVGNLI